MPFPTYSIHSETATGVVDEATLHQELLALVLSSASLVGIRVAGPLLTVVLDQQPGAPDAAAVDAAVQAHRPPPRYRLATSETIIGTAAGQAVSISSWVDLAGVVRDVGAHVAHLEEAQWLVEGQVRTTLGDVGLRLALGDGTVLTPEVRLDTDSNWVEFAFTTDQLLPVGRQVYVLQAALVSAVTATVRFAGVTLREQLR